MLSHVIGVFVSSCIIRGERSAHEVLVWMVSRTVWRVEDTIAFQSCSTGIPVFVEAWGVDFDVAEFKR